MRSFSLKRLASVFGQTFRDFEFVIVEDPSTGIRRFDGGGLQQDARLRHICNLQRTSYLHQRKQTLVEARGDLIAVIDADDIWEADKLERQVAFLHSHPRVAVVGAQVSVIDDYGRFAATDHIPAVMPRLSESHAPVQSY